MSGSRETQRESYRFECLTRQKHPLLDGHRVLPRPLLDLLVHLVHLGRVHGPEAAFSLVRPRHDGLIDLLEALVKGEVVAHRVFPAGGCRLEVREVFAEKKTFK